MSYYENLSNKDSLLVAMGDSWTEGVGCYDPDLLQAYLSKKIDMSNLYRQSHLKGLFSLGSWPKQLSDMIGCDLINIGEGGDSNSASAKRLIQEYHHIISQKTKSYKKVTFIWLISAPERFSFYSNKRLTNFLQESGNKIKKAYHKDVVKDIADPLLETSFYLRAVDWYCKANGYNFLYGSAFYPMEEMEKIYNPDHNIHRYMTRDCMSAYLDFHDDSLWAPCRHPSEKGYTIIAERLYSVINESFKGVL